MKHLLIIFQILLLALPLYSIPQLEFVDMIISEEMEDELDTISGIFLSPKDYVVVTDHGNNKIYWLNHEGRIVRKIGESGDDPGEFNEPGDLYINKDGIIYVADTGNDRIQVFNKKGSFLYEFGRSGDENGEFSSPQGVYVSGNGHIYIADTGNNRIQVFSKKGVFISKFGTDGDEGGEFDNPVSVAVDEEENVYVSDQGNNRVQVFDRDGLFIFSFGVEGDEAGQFDTIGDIFYDNGAERLIITDMNLHLIHIYNKDGSFFTSFGNEGENQGEFESPRSIMVSEKGEIYVADTGNKRIQIFQINEPRMTVEFELPEPEKEKTIIAPEKKQVVNVFKFENIGKQAQESDYGEVIAHNLFAELSAGDYFETIEKSRVKKALKKYKLENQSINKENAVKVGNDIYVGCSIIGTVSKLEGTIDVDVRILNTLSGKVIHSFYEKISNEAKIRETCKKIVKRIIKYYDDNNIRILKIPTGLKTSEGSQSVILKWNKNKEKDIAGYNIYRSEEEDRDYRFIGWSGKASYKDMNLGHEKRYYYKITGVNNYGYETDFSIFKSCQPLPPPELPVIKDVKITGDVREVKIQWSKVEKKIMAYKIYRAVEDKSDKYKLIKEIKDNNFTDKDVESLKTYYYKVTAFNKDVESKVDDADFVSVKVKALVKTKKPENIREKPSSKSKKLARVNKGVEIPFLGEEAPVGTSGKNAYLKVRMKDGKTGWIWKASVEIIK